MLQLQFLIHTLNGISSPRTVTIPFQIWSKRFKATPETSDHLSTSFFKKKTPPTPNIQPGANPLNLAEKKTGLLFQHVGFPINFQDLQQGNSCQSSCAGSSLRWGPTGRSSKKFRSSRLQLWSLRRNFGKQPQKGALQLWSLRRKLREVCHKGRPYPPCYTKMT